MDYDSNKIDKFDVKLKSNPKDGIILQLHHTLRESNGERKRIRFSSAAFDDNNEKLACADNGGNIFVLDFSDLKFWKLSNIGPCSVIQFVPTKQDTLVVATAKKYEISFVDTETGTICLTLPGHTTLVRHISYSNNKKSNLLTASAAEAILWELKNHTKYFTLNTYLGAQIQQILFSPAGDFLVACFQNDTVQIWKHESMKSVKQIIPNNLKHMKSLAFTMNGRAMAMAGLVPLLILFSMDNWKPIKSIDLTKHEITGVHQIAFIPQVFDGGANKILAILSSDCNLYIYDLESLSVNMKIAPESSAIKRFVVSPTGKYFLCILELGEVNIYNSSYVMDVSKSESMISKKELPSTSSATSCKHVKPKSLPSKTEMEHKMKTCMDSSRLRRILMQYGEYPDKFRSVIWRSLLDTPRNKTAYAALVDKGIHPAYTDIEKKFTIHSSTTLKNLKRVLSCLAHWCPLFGVIKFLPSFVFPFVKVLQKDPLLLFECVATVLLNYCQLWFEYAPFPPISVLAMVENTLAEHDQSLLNYYCSHEITSQTYALTILETAFSEILSCSEWLILWDHILSNEPAYILMAVVSYNIVQRNAIKRLRTLEKVDNFFHMQNPIDKKTFLKKIYILLNETSEEIHPRKFFESFTALEKGDCYQQFTAYPKATICMKLAKKERAKSSKSEKYSLKDLTSESQRKQIKERMRKRRDSKCFQSDDESARSITKERRHKDGYEKGDHLQKDITEYLINSIMYPALMHTQLSKDGSMAKSNKKEKHKHSSRTKTKRRNHENETVKNEESQ